MLIVPEWNRDLNTFEALVESAALDIHAYVVQVNNRLYGDSRVRVPKGEPYGRDIARVRGGRNDYFVVAALEVRDLRAFQSQASSLSKVYKPLPDGFELSDVRGAVPVK